MTTVVYKDGMIAADTQVTSGGRRVEGRMTKIVRGPDGTLGGAAGSAAYVQAFREWAVLGKPESPPEAKEDSGDDAFLVYPNGTVRFFDSDGYSDIATTVVAIGSGADYAYGALAMGATAEQAVKIAIAMDVYSSEPIEVLKRDEDG